MDANHEDIKDLIAAYVLGAVDQNEVAMVRVHILSCDECLAEADRLAAVAAKLPLVGDDVPLPRGFSDRVVAAALGEHETEPASVMRHKRRWSFAPVLAAGLAATIAVLGFAFLRTRGELQQKERVLTALLRSEEGFELSGAGVTAKLVPGATTSYFVAAGLHEAPTEHAYQLWLLREGEPTSAGVFNVTDGIALVEVDHDIDAFDAAAVTVEPEGGSPSPTSDPILTSS